MKKRIKVAELPEFDAAPYLDSEATVAAYLTDVIEAYDASLLTAALGVRLVVQPISP
jgi:DNA-binding phage protein